MHQYLLCVDFLDYISITAPESKENRKREWFIKEGDISRLNLCTKQTEEQKQANTCNLKRRISRTKTSNLLKSLDARFQNIAAEVCVH